MCYTDQELVDAVAASGGRVFIGIAAPEFPRAAQAARERRLPRWADAEWGAQVLEVKNARAQVQEEFRSLSVVAARIDPADAPRLRRLPHTWYVEPQFARYIRRPDAPEGPRMMACPMYVSDCNSPTEPTDPIDPPTDPDPRGTTSVTEAYADLRTTQLVGWNVVNPGITSQYGGPWMHNYKGQNMKVGIIDGEVMITHPKLSANLIERRNYTSQAFGSPDGHATWVAGAVVAPESGYGTVGAAPQAKYYNAKVCAGSGCSTTGILNAVDWLSLAGAHVINMSLGGGGCSLTER
ncbi:MAG TPA: S8 family serine peptidase, partial [Longimicrobium sp.]